MNSPQENPRERMPRVGDRVFMMPYPLTQKVISEVLEVKDEKLVINPGNGNIALPISDFEYVVDTGEFVHKLDKFEYFHIHLPMRERDAFIKGKLRELDLEKERIGLKRRALEASFTAAGGAPEKAARLTRSFFEEVEKKRA